MRKTVIFDLDGVIFDSEQVVRQGWRYAAEQLYLGQVDHLFLQCVGTNHIFTERLLQEQFGQEGLGALAAGQGAQRAGKAEGGQPKSGNRRRF